MSLTVGDETVEFSRPEYPEVEYEEYGDERELERSIQEDDLEIDSE